MNRIISIFLLFALLTQVFSLSMLYGVYHFQQDFITDKYCENIEQPQLMCAGSCFIGDMAQLLDANTEDQSTSASSIQLPSLAPFILQLAPSIKTVTFTSSTANFGETLPIHRLLATSIFHPPQDIS
ncbi:MAG: hypothetical protein AAGG68_07530 [Bacteroidota bacterium]